MLLADFLSIMILIFLSISISSPTLLPQILTILSKSTANTGCLSLHHWCVKLLKEPIIVKEKNTDVKRRAGFQTVKIFQALRQTVKCGEKERIVQNRHGPIKCVKGPREKDAKCTEVAEKTKEENPCILHKEENITIPDNKIKMHLELPWALKPGMKLTVHGKRHKGHKRCQFSFSKDPKHYTAMWAWIHFWINWYTSISFTYGFKTSFYEGKFPISDDSHFTLSMEITQSSTKFYADEVLVKTLEYFPGVKEFYLHKFRKIYLLVVQKTDEGCGNVTIGL